MVFPAEQVAAWREEMLALCTASVIKNVEQANTDPQSKTVRPIFRGHEFSRGFSSLARNHALLDIITTILDDEVYIHQSRANAEPGFRGKEFYRHGDFEFRHVEDGMPRMRAVSISIALSGNNEFNGPLMLIRGLHHTCVSCVGETPEEHYKSSLRTREYGAPDSETLSEMAQGGSILSRNESPGSVIIFDYNTMHGLNGNISPFLHSNAFYVYNTCSNRFAVPHRRASWNRTFFRAGKRSSFGGAHGAGRKGARGIT